MKKINKLSRCASNFGGGMLSGLVLVSGCGVSLSTIADEVLALEEVVVTARKREENLQDTPVSVTALTADSLERRNLVNTEDLDQVAPNLQFTSFAPSTGNSAASSIFIRGVGQIDSTAGVDPGVGLYIDDVYIGHSVGGAMDFRDISGVQVLRGPQGTLFGRNTIGGAILLTTTEPGDELGGSVGFGTGEGALAQLTAAIDIPVSDTVKTRFTGGVRSRDGYVTRNFDGQDLGDENTFTVSGKLRWDPSDSFSLMFKADHSEEDENGSPLVFAGANEEGVFPAYESVVAGCPGATFPPPSVPQIDDERCVNDFYSRGPYNNEGTFDVKSEVSNSSYSLVMSWDLSDELSIKSITAYRELEWFGSRDADNTPYTLIHTTFDAEGDQVSQELQFNYSADSLSGLMGLYYYDDENNEYFQVYLPDLVGYVDNNNYTVKNNNWAAFTHWTYDFNSAFSVYAGVRYTEEEKTGNFIAYNTAAPNTNYVTEGDHTLDFESTTVAAGLQYSATDNTMLYAGYSEGFKSGGFNTLYNGLLPIGDGGPVPFDQEEVKSFEVGFKSDLASNLRLNGAVFSSKYEDMQLTYRVTIVPLLFNAGEASIDGAELELSWLPTSALMIEGALGYLDGTIDSVVDIPSAVTAIDANKELPFTPELTGNLGVEYSFNTSSGYELTPRIDVIYTDSQFMDAVNTPEISQTSAETVVNLNFSLRSPSDSWGVLLGVKNATNEAYRVAGNSSLSTASGYGEVAYSRPREWFLNLNIDF